MRFQIKPLALAIGLIWSAAIFIVALVNHIWPDYGRAFLETIASVYPGYNPATGIGSVIVGALYGLVDGAIGGALFGWLYNALADRISKPGE